MSKTIQVISQELTSLGHPDLAEIIKNITFAGNRDLADSISNIAIAAKELVENAKKKGEWNIVILKSRSLYYLTEVNPSGGSGGGMSFNSVKKALNFVFSEKNVKSFKGAKKVWIIIGEFDYDVDKDGGYVVKKKYWEDVPSY